MKPDLGGIKEWGCRRTVILILLALILGLIYSALTGLNFVVGFLAMVFAVFGSYILLLSFGEEEVLPPMDRDENIILETIDKAYVVSAGKKGGFPGKKSHDYLSLYLTNKRIIGRDVGVVLDINLKSIRGLTLERKLFREYIRVTYLEDGGEMDVLLITGDTSLWMRKLRELGVE